MKTSSNHASVDLGSRLSDRLSDVMAARWLADSLLILSLAVLAGAIW